MTISQALALAVGARITKYHQGDARWYTGRIIERHRKSMLIRWDDDSVGHYSYQFVHSLHVLSN